MKPNTLLAVGLLLGSPLLASADSIRIGVGIAIPERPPAAVVESYGPAPAPGYVWIGGHWFSHRHRWVWQPGHWGYRQGFAWSPGHWAQTEAGWMWVEGQWVPAAVMAGPVSYGPPTAPEVVVEEAPPAPMVETYGPAPGPDFFWITGRWARVGGRWSWAGGRWERHPHPHPGGAWIAGHWNHGPHGYVWIEGRWR